MKPCLPSSASAAPLNPSRTSVAAIRPFSAAQPTWKRFVQAPLARNCRLPAAWDSTVPERVGDAVGVQAEHPGGGGGGTEGAAGRGGMVAAVVMLAGGQGEGDRGR